MSSAVILSECRLKSIWSLLSLVGSMLNLKHVVHPIRTAQIATRRLVAHIDLRRFASHSEQHFRGDSRYDLKYVTEGFASRIDASTDDTSMLERICRAYARTVSHPDSALACYGPTEWWGELRQSCLGPAMRAHVVTGKAVMT